MVLLLGITMTLNIMMISSVYWFPSWVILELVGFVFMMVLSISRANSVSKKVSMWKYFLFQCMGSIFLLLCLFMKVNQLSYVGSSFMDMIMMSGLMMKVGLPPFHKWSFEISENLNWLKFLLLNSVQKVPSLVMVWKLMDMSWLVILMSMYVMLFSLIMIKDWSLRRFLLYSSLLNYTWIVLCSSIDSLSMFMYLMVYMWTFMGVVLAVSKFSFSCFSFLFTNNSLMMMGSLLNIFLGVNIMSLAGLPPLAGFIIKYDLVMCLIWNCLILVSLMIMMISMIMLYMYLMLIISSSITSKLLNECLSMINPLTIVMCVFNLLAPLLYFM